MLSDDGRRRVEEAVRDAEVGTAGEIVVVLARQASRYRAVPFLYGLVAALLAPWPLILFTDLGPVRIFSVQLGAAIAVLLACASPALRSWLVPGPIRRARAREAAQHEFASRGMADTRGRTGVLLFVSAAERHAEVIGDVAISARVAEEEWREVIEALVEGLGRGREAEALADAVRRIGAVLVRHAPAGARDIDELPNRIILL